MDLGVDVVVKEGGLTGAFRRRRVLMLGLLVTSVVPKSRRREIVGSSGESSRLFCLVDVGEIFFLGLGLHGSRSSVGAVRLDSSSDIVGD